MVDEASDVANFNFGIEVDVALILGFGIGDAEADGMLRCAPSVADTWERGAARTTFIRIVSRLFWAPGAIADAFTSRSEMRRSLPVAVSRRLIGSAMVCVAPGSAPPIGAADAPPDVEFELLSTLKRFVSVFFASFSFGVGFSFSLITALPYLE